MNSRVTGARGQLGTDLVTELTRRGHTVTPADVEQFDITVREQVRAFVTATAPEVIIHCAAFTATDRAEDEPELCRRVNEDGTRYLAEIAGERDIKMIYISTDYVFDGKGQTPFSVADAAAPISVYGRTKYAGECAVRALAPRHMIVRTAWVFGVHGKNFVRTMLNLAKTRDTLTVVCDQIGSPTYTPDLSRLLADMAVSDRYGTYHATNEGFCSWYEFACEIFRQAGLPVKVTPVTSDQYPAKIKRPANSRLDKSALTENGFDRLPPWQDALTRFLAEYRKEEQV